MGMFQFGARGNTSGADGKGKGADKSRVNWVTLVLGLLIAVVLGLMMNRCDAADPKTFQTGDFAITLTEEFKEETLEDAYAYYYSEAVIAAVDSVLIAEEGDMTAQEYAVKMVKQAGGEEDAIAQKDGLAYCAYTTDTEDGELFYMVFFLKGETRYWVLNFVTMAANQELCQEDFLNYAKSAVVG